MHMIRYKKLSGSRIKLWITDLTGLDSIGLDWVDWTEYKEWACERLCSDEIPRKSIIIIIFIITHY